MDIMNAKILEIEDLAERIRELKSKGKKVVQCHGCFDLVHVGHVQHFMEARQMGDILIVTITSDKHVDKGPERPAFDQDLRAEFLAALECVNYVAVNKWPTAEDTLRLLKPDIYVKGQEFETLEDKTGKIQKEYEVITEIGAEIRFTHGAVFSSTKLLSKYFRQ
jgi:rfaE bifunctional protein nucleotidyltransferase chain/domain